MRLPIWIRSLIAMESNARRWNESRMRIEASHRVTRFGSRQAKGWYNIACGTVTESDNVEKTLAKHGVAYRRISTTQFTAYMPTMVDRRSQAVRENPYANAG